MVRLASDLLVQSIDDAGARLAPRASQMVVALTERRYAEVRFGPRGVGEVIDGTAKTSIPFVQLPPGDRDLVALALRLAVVEAACKQAGRLPVFYDQVFDAYDAARMPLLTKAVQFLAQGTQVVLVTARRELAGAGTVVQGQRPQGKA